MIIGKSSTVDYRMVALSAQSERLLPSAFPQKYSLAHLSATLTELDNKIGKFKGNEAFHWTTKNINLLFKLNEIFHQYLRYKVNLHPTYTGNIDKNLQTIYSVKVFLLEEINEEIKRSQKPSLRWQLGTLAKAKSKLDEIEPDTIKLYSNWLAGLKTPVPYEPKPSNNIVDIKYLLQNKIKQCTEDSSASSQTEINEISEENPENDALEESLKRISLLLTGSSEISSTSRRNRSYSATINTEAKEFSTPEESKEPDIKRDNSMLSIQKRGKPFAAA